MIAKHLRHARSKKRIAGQFLAMVVFLACALPAQARDMTGKGGVGALITTEGVPMAVFRYWRTNVALEGLLGYVASTPTPATVARPDTTQVRVAIGFLYRLHDAQRASLALGVRPWLQYTLTKSPDQNDQSNWRLGAEIPLQAEVFLNDHFSLIGHAGLTIDLAQPQARGDGLTTTLDQKQDTSLLIGVRGGFSGGAGFTYYF